MLKISEEQRNFIHAFISRIQFSGQAIHEASKAMKFLEELKPIENRAIPKPPPNRETPKIKK